MKRTLPSTLTSGNNIPQQDFYTINFFTHYISNMKNSTLTVQKEKKLSSIKKTFLLFNILFLGLISFSNAQTFTSTKSGNWNDPTVWGGTVPSNNTSTTVVIAATHTVTVSAAITNTAYAEIRIAGTLKFAAQFKTNNGDNGGLTNTTYGNALTTYKVRMIANGATIDLNGQSTCNIPNLLIDLPNTTDVANIIGGDATHPFNFNIAGNGLGSLVFIKGLLKATGQYLKFSKGMIMGGNANGNFATSIDGTCLHVDADAGTIVETSGSGEDTYLRDANVNFYNLTFTSNNFTFNEGGFVTILGTYTSARTSAGGAPTVSGGVFRWGPNSLYTGTFTPKGECTSLTAAAGPAKTGTSPGTANGSYVTPTAIQTAINACLPVITADQTGLAQTTSGNILQGSAGTASTNILSNFTVRVTNANATLNTAAFTGTGNFVAGDITNYYLYTNTTASLTGATLLKTVPATSLTGTSAVSFGSLTQACNVGTPQYFFVTADVGAAATAGKTVIVPLGGSSPNLVLTFASGTPANSITVGGTKTIVGPAPIVTTTTATSITTTGAVLNGSINPMGNKYPLL
ncbi:MAG: hypothetical protein WDM71_06095, partial [Ferruginibacter sp.]